MRAEGLARLRLRPTRHAASRKLDTFAPSSVSQAKLEQTGEAAVLLVAAVARILVKSDLSLGPLLTTEATRLFETLNGQGKHRAADLALMFVGALRQSPAA